MQNSTKPREDLATTAHKIRNMVLDIIYEAKSTHVGCALSIVDILTTLYFGDVLKIDPENPEWPDRDIFILSKGHACVALYATLALRGFLPIEKLKEYGTDGTLIGDHNTRGALPGIETSNGSLGHGLSLGIGMALAAKNAERKSRVFVLVGDGELQEGSNWEAMMFAAHHKLDNLILIIDHNGLETVGKTSEIVSLSNLHWKLKGFGWSEDSVNGHGRREIADQIDVPHPTQPRALIAYTTKSKGIPFMSGDYIWHGQRMSPEQYAHAKRELNGDRQ